MTNPFWTTQARVELARQTEYIAAFDPVAAGRINDRIEQRANWLVEFPRAGARLGRGPARSFSVRGTPYSIVYRPLRDTVLILRIFHAKQNWR